MLPLSRAIYLWRSERGLTQDELARKAGVSRPNLSGMEQGKREVSLRTLRLLASALGIAPGLLVDGVSPLSLRISGRFSRDSLERIADAATGRVGAKGEEKELAGLLKTVMSERLSGKKRRAGKRRLAAAWLQLRSACPPEVFRSLIQRIEDRERLKGAPRGPAGNR